MPIPVIVAKLVAAAPKIVAFASSVAPFVAKNNKAREAQNSANLQELFSKIEAKQKEYSAMTPEQRAELVKSKVTAHQNKTQNSDEQSYDSTTGTEKAFLGLQTVEAGKKQQTKIIMIAGGILLLLFFFMKKK
jgi:ABC-type Na+ efflux pump permease subunit